MEGRVREGPLRGGGATAETEGVGPMAVRDESVLEDGMSSMLSGSCGSWPCVPDYALSHFRIAHHIDSIGLLQFPVSIERGNFFFFFF